MTGRVKAASWARQCEPSTSQTGSDLPRFLSSVRRESSCISLSLPKMIIDVLTEHRRYALVMCVSVVRSLWPSPHANLIHSSAGGGGVYECPALYRYSGASLSFHEHNKRYGRDQARKS